MRGRHLPRTAPTIMSWMDSYIYSFRASHNPPSDPQGISVTREQYDTLKKWADDHPHHGSLVVDSTGGLTYKSIKVRTR